LRYNVVLLDLTPELLEIAEKQIKKAKVRDKVKQILQGSIVDLYKFRNNSFDAVICLGGALSHIVNRKQREKAIDELIRVAKKNAPIFVSVIGRPALLVNALVIFPREITIKKLFDWYRDTGDYHGGYGFAPCYFYLPEELKVTFKKRKIKIIEMVGLEGLSSTHRRETDQLFKTNPRAWQVWWKTHLKICTNPTVVGMSEHFMIICRK
jgi:ubiquinone/menaquinone biosynthesis C-methylase UbiE